MHERFVSVDSVRSHVLDAVVREPVRRELSDLLRGMSCPTLIAHAIGEGTSLKPEALELCLESCQKYVPWDSMGAATRSSKRSSCRSST